MTIKKPPLDWSTTFTEGEYDGILSTYAGLLGGGDVRELFWFVPTLHDHAPEALKRYRLWINAVTMGRGLDTGLPNPPVASLVSGHFYATLPYGEGLIGDLMVARRVGGTKREVMDIVSLAALHAGPHGMNVTSRVLKPLLDEWGPETGTGIDWGAGWHVDPDAFRCGVDFGVDRGQECTPDEISAIREWHRRVQGEVPPSVEFLAEHHPLALVVSRARFETATTGLLPREFVALCWVHLATAWAQPDALRRYLHLAREFGVARDHVVQIMALALLYTGETRADVLAHGAADALVGWDA